jgi:hypothetical protein
MAYLCTHGGEAVVQNQTIRNLDIKGRGWSATRPGRFSPGKYLVPVVQDTGRLQCQCKPVAKVSPPTGIRAQDQPSRSLSLYRLCYLCRHFRIENTWKIHLISAVVYLPRIVASVSTIAAMNSAVWKYSNIYFNLHRSSQIASRLSLYNLIHRTSGNICVPEYPLTNLLLRQVYYILAIFRNATLCPLTFPVVWQDVQYVEWGRIVFIHSIS